MAKRKKIIQVPHGNVGKICEAFRCKQSAVYKALSFESNSELSKAIRQNALAFYGGIQTTKIVFN